MIGTMPMLLVALLLALSSCVGNSKPTVGFRLSLMPPCHTPPQQRSATDFMGDSVTLELHVSGHPTINGDDGHARPWLVLLKELFSYRSYKTLLLAPDQEVSMEQILTVLDQLQKDLFLNRIILLTPKQIKDIENEFCIMNNPS